MASSRLISALEKKKLVTRRESERDSRVKHLSCTEKGVSYLDEMSLERVRAAARVLGSLPEKTFHQLFLTIKKMKEGKV